VEPTFIAEPTKCILLIVKDLNFTRKYKSYYVSWRKFEDRDIRESRVFYTWAFLCVNLPAACKASRLEDEEQVMKNCCCSRTRLIICTLPGEHMRHECRRKIKGVCTWIIIASLCVGSLAWFHCIKTQYRNQSLPTEGDTQLSTNNNEIGLRRVTQYMLSIST
jgi:hypothetical protein